MTSGGYSTPAAVEAAILTAARKAAAEGSSSPVSDRIRQEHFHRFLSRVFSGTDHSEWILKGGTGILARVGSARTTTDVDLFRKDCSLDAALEELKYLASLDLNDFFRFEYIGHTNAIGGGHQIYTEGYRVNFGTYIGLF